MAGWILTRKHDFATFVHKRLKWTFADQSLEGFATEWLCVNVDGCEFVSIYKPSNSELTPTAIPVFQDPSLYFGDFNVFCRTGHSLADHELVRNYNFTLTTDTGLHSRLRHFKNGVLQGSVLAPLLLNIYIHDLPVTIARKFAYADNLAI